VVMTASDRTVQEEAAEEVKNKEEDILATVASKLNPRLKNLENFEAMTFGPTLPDGRRTLLLISDNNSSDKQVTALVVLAMPGPKAQSPKPRP